MKTITTPKDLAEALRTAKTATLLARALTTEMDADIAAIKNRFEHRIDAAKLEAQAELEAVQAYAAKAGPALFGNAKTATIDGHKLGFRDNGGAIKTAKGVTEKKALANLLRFPRLARLFTRNKPSLDKEAIMAKWAAFKGNLTKLGFRLVREEVFFVELDITPDPAAAGGKGGK